MRKNNKIGIITFHQVTNLGAALQASALCKYINKNISPCEIIDFVPNSSCGNKIMQRLPLLRASKNAVLNIKNAVLHNRTSKFASFQKESMIISSSTYYGDKDMKRAAGKYDVLISGSDQILNSTLSGNSTSYYLSFDDKAKKISYASSFGRKDISQTEQLLIQTHLPEFDKISVR